ncbi:MAG: Gfo/Idh/MocA family protein [Dissulfuribacterales bacterium]
MYKVVIYGAGSIGNHLAHACRTKGWDVVMCDVDPEALKRTKEDIYPSRYGRWDQEIRLSSPDMVSGESFDVAVIGVPPDMHVRLATEVLEKNPPEVLLIEKPLCTPSLDGVQKLVELQKATGCFVAVGYNHCLTENSKHAARLLAENKIGKAITISARFREHWGGIFNAHPWLSGPVDSYLGFSDRGGGASGEHSHAINIWQHFARLAGGGRIVKVSATMDMIADGIVKYDRICLINVRTENGLVGDIVQDVVTEPPQKNVRIQGEIGFLEWIVNADDKHDAVRYKDGLNDVRDKIIPKTRPDDFKGEIDHIEAILNGGDRPGSSISLARGLDTMMVIAAAHISFRHKRSVKIDYDRGYSLDSIELI